MRRRKGVVESVSGIHKAADQCVRRVRPRTRTRCQTHRSIARRVGKGVGLQWKGRGRVEEKKESNRDSRNTSAARYRYVEPEGMRERGVDGGGLRSASRSNRGRLQETAHVRIILSR